MVKVTVFGLAATGKSTVSKITCDNLNLTYMSSGNMFRETAKSKGLSVYEFDSLCKSDLKYDIELDNLVKTFGENNDNFIFESRLAWYFIPDSVKIKLSCELDKRIKRVMQRDLGDFEETKKLTLQRELDVIERYSKLYGLTNYESDSNFDLVIDTTTLTIDEVVEKISNFISKKEFNLFK